MRIVSVGVEDAALTEPGVATRITLMAGPHLDCPAHDVVCVAATRLDGEWTLQLTTRTPDLIGAVEVQAALTAIRTFMPATRVTRPPWWKRLLERLT